MILVRVSVKKLTWCRIPFERALEFANKEKITEQLYPLFVHDIGALLYHPSNQTTRASVGSAAMAAVDRNRRPDPMQAQRYLSGPTTSQPPSLHHHHSMSNPIGAAMSQASHAIQPHPSAGRPGLDRAHTFPTPPTSASSIMGMGNQGSSYEWNAANVQPPQGSQPLSIDTGLSNARSVPTTPATTPPGAVQQGNQYGSAQSYDNPRPMYSGPPSQPGQYSQGQPMMGYRPDSSYPKTEMAPPSRLADVSEDGDVKHSDGMMPQGNSQGAAPPAGAEGDHEHDNEYTHSNAPYNGNRSSYGYNPNGNPGAIHPDHPHLSPEMTGSPHQNGSGRATPRTTSTPQTQWNSSGYPTPQRQGLPSSNLYNVMSDPRGAPNGAPHDGYPGPGAVPQYASQGYPPSNGVNNAGKRGRDDEDDDPYRPDSVQGDDMGGLKRRKTMEGGAVGGAYPQDPNPGLQRAHTMAHNGTAQRARR
jgi:protein SOK2